jgi:hypothetical protein
MAVAHPSIRGFNLAVETAPDLYWITMKPQINIITLGVSNITKARKFYEMGCRIRV